jgi:hypothetical protein
LIEAKRQGIAGVGFEANPLAHFASSTKLDWSPEPDRLVANANRAAELTRRRFAEREPLKTLPEHLQCLLLKDSISALPLHKALALLENLRSDRFYPHELLALAKTLVFSASNLQFGPEVGVSRKKKSDAPVIEVWLKEVCAIAADLRCVQTDGLPSSIVYLADSRQPIDMLSPGSVDAVFTSPPYPNEKDYTRTTRLESVILGFVNSKEDLQKLKKGLLRSNTRNVYKGDDDDAWVSNHPEIQRIASEIERKRVELGKTSGFERLYGKVTRLYFGGMARHLSELRSVLKPGAYLGYVVGDQASYFQVMIRTGKLLADIAKSLGYEVVGIDLFRTRLATATRMQMREEVVVLRRLG